MFGSLYHGTSERLLDRILRDGLRPRAAGTKGNFPKLPSGLGRVYLTDSYALWYAAHGQRESDKGRLAVLRVDCTGLDWSRFCADEDWLQHAMRTEGYVRTRNNIGERNRTLAARDIAVDRPDLAASSLEGLGTLAYRGRIPPEAITGVALVGLKHFARCVMCGYDPSVTPLAHRFVKERYRAWMDWLFGGTPQLEDFPGQPYEFPPHAEYVELRLADKVS